MFLYISICIFVFFMIFKKVKNNDNKFKRLSKTVQKYEKDNNCKILIITDKFWEELPTFLEKRIMELDECEETFMKWFQEDYHSNKKLEIIIHTYGGTIRSSDLIFVSLMNYRGKVNVYIPFYAYSAGAMIAFAGKKLYMNPYAVLGPVDPQIYFTTKSQDMCPSNSLLTLETLKNKDCIKDDVLINLTTAKSYHQDNIDNLQKLFLKKNYPTETIEVIIDEFASGKHPHNKPFDIHTLKTIGLKIKVNIPTNIEQIFTQLMDTKS